MTHALSATFTQDAPCEPVAGGAEISGHDIERGPLSMSGGEAGRFFAFLRPDSRVSPTCSEEADGATGKMSDRSNAFVWVPRGDSLDCTLNAENRLVSITPLHTPPNLPSHIVFVSDALLILLVRRMCGAVEPGTRTMPCEPLASLFRAVLSGALRPVPDCGHQLDDLSLPSPVLPPRLARTTRFIDANLCGDLSTATLAAVACLSEAHFSRVFKKALGQSPHQYVMSRRVRAACALIDRNACALSAVALDCGFASQSHMTDVFRARIGQTPGQYKRDRIAARRIA